MVYALTFEACLRSTKGIDCLAALSGIQSDITLLVNDEQVRANKKLLSVFSKDFEKLFQDDSDKVKLDNITSSDLLQLLSFIYQITGKSDIKEDNIEVLLEMAVKFNISNVLNRCEYFLKTSADINLSKKLLLSQAYGFKIAQELKECLTFDQLIALKKDLSDKELDASTYKTLFNNICDKRADEETTDETDPLAATWIKSDNMLTTYSPTTTS
uniref:BTB domain-containing protein n=1 Tax=Ditylenchus dipsaci TaxID=166011 RepID=A0A915E9Q3_9BILA